MDEYWYAKRGGGGVHTPPKMYVGRNSSVVTGAGAAVAAPALSIVDCAGYNYRMGFAQRGDVGEAVGPQIQKCQPRVGLERSHASIRRKDVHLARFAPGKLC